MELKNYITELNNVIPYKILSSFIKYINTLTFIKAKIVGDEQGPEENLNVRRTLNYPLSNFNTSLSDIHWANYLANVFNSCIKYYIDKNKIFQIEVRKIVSIDILKYEESGFYEWHSDHAAEAPRTLSMIFMLNNEYQGGNLCFRDPNGTNEYEIKNEPNKIIIWPSTFLYPHTVKPVTKGIRYSVVAWAL